MGGYVVNTRKLQKKNSGSPCRYTFVIAIELYYNLQLGVIVIKVSYYVCVYHIITLSDILSLNYTANCKVQILTYLHLNFSLKTNIIHNEMLLFIMYAYNILNKLNI